MGIAAKGNVGVGRRRMQMKGMAGLGWEKDGEFEIRV